MEYSVRRTMLAKTLTLVACALGLPGPAISSAVAAAEYAFEQYEVVTGSARRQTVLTGFFLGGAVADLAVVHIDGNGDRRLSIYAFGDGTWQPALDATLGSEVSFVDVANIGGRDRLIMYERGLPPSRSWDFSGSPGSPPGRLNWFDPESGTERELVAVSSDFNPPPGREIPHVDVTKDVNGDGRDDLVVPDGHGFRVFIQGSDGAFADPVKIGPSTGMGRVYGADGYRYDPWASGRVHELDYDRDGLSDLAFWNEDHFEVHLQDELGLFAAVATTFTTDVAFDSDQIASLVAPEGVRHRRRDEQPTTTEYLGEFREMTGRVLHSLADMNGDGVADLVVFWLQGGNLWNMHSTYEVHFGAPAPDGGTVFAQDVSIAIESDGILFELDQHDFDGDGQVDMRFTSIKPGVFKVIGMVARAILTRTASVDVDFYRMDGGTYPDKPNATRKIQTATPSKSGGKTYFPPVLVGDVNGDGRSDLLVGKGRKELRVFMGVPGPDLFARRPQKVAVAMPKDEEYTWLSDLNKDGKQDVLIHDPSTTESHRLTLLIAR